MSPGPSPQPVTFLHTSGCDLSHRPREPGSSGGAAAPIDLGLHVLVVGGPVSTTFPVHRRFRFSVHGSFLLLLLIMSGAGSRSLDVALPIAAAIAALVVIHELGHAGVVLASGGSAHVRLIGLMGLTSFEPELYRSWSRWRQAAVVVGGPGLGVLVALLLRPMAPAFVTSPTGVFWDVFTRYGIWLNLLNLLPLTGLDGQALLKLIVRADDHPDRAHAVRAVGVVLAIVAAGLAWQHHMLITAAFVILNAGADFKQLRPEPEANEASRRIDELAVARDRGEVTRAEELTAAIDAVTTSIAERELVHTIAMDAQLLVGDVAAAERHVIAFVSPTSRARAQARIELARCPRLGWAMLARQVAQMTNGAPPVLDVLAADEAEDVARAFVLARLHRIPVHEATVITVSLRVARLWEPCKQAAQQLYQRGAAGHAAYALAVAHAQTGEAGEALRWLQVAVDRGQVKPRELRDNVELRPLVGLPAFQRLTGAVSVGWSSDAVPPAGAPVPTTARTILPEL